MSVYVIGRVTVTNPEDYRTYARQTADVASAYGGRFLVKGGPQEVLEGNCPERHVVIEFPDREAALGWYRSDAYRRILPIALSSSDRDIVIVDGI